MKNPFRRRRPVDLQDAEITSLRQHLHQVVFYARMDGTAEAMEDAAKHMVTDLTARTPRDLAALAGMLIAEGAVKEADALRVDLSAAVRDIMESLGRTSGEAATTDLLGDDEPTPAPEGVSEAQNLPKGVSNDHAASLRDVAEEKDWPEDRR